MKRAPLAIALAMTAAATAATPALHVAPDTPQRLAQLPRTVIDYDRALLSEKDKQVVAKLIEATKAIDELYWRQVSEENPAWRAELAKQASRSPLDKAAYQYFLANKGPWDRLDQVPEQYFERIPQPWPSVENTFTRSLTDLGMGTKYTAEIAVDGKVEQKQFDVVPSPSHFGSAPRYKSDALGMTVRDMTFEVRRYMQRSPQDPGVVISKIEPGGRASVAGFSMTGSSGAVAD